MSNVVYQNSVTISKYHKIINTVICFLKWSIMQFSEHYTKAFGHQTGQSSCSIELCNNFE